MKQIGLFFIAFLYSASLMAQANLSALQEQEENLNQMLTELRAEKERGNLNKLNEAFKVAFLNALEIDGAFKYPFTSLKSVGKIYSQDGLVRIISWNIQYEDLTHEYAAFVMKYDENKKKATVVELKHVNQNLYGIQDERIEADNWYGALYYEIIDVEKRNRTFYTLLGYVGNNDRSTIKLMDALYFTGKTPHFGSPIFESSRGKSNRLIFEYNAKATMSLKYDADRKKIILDHLSPESASLSEFREFYVPDLSYDSYSWNGKIWELKEDIIAINKEQKTINLEAYDKDLDTVVTIPTKNKWINPENSDSPIDDGKHKAALPDDGNQGKKASKKEKHKKTKKASKREENTIPGVSGYKVKKRKKR